MVDLNNIQKVYFIGIGGIGMSALARYFKFHGKQVSGYDKTETALTKKLAEEGIDVHYEDKENLVPKDAELIIYTPAVPKDHIGLNFFQKNNYPVLKRSEVLGAITRSTYNIAVAGTHGKTTITSMVAHILRDTGYGCNAFLGGISGNYESNFWANERKCSVIEADEYDRSFLRLSPDIAVISAMDADHLDIYGDEKTMQDAFIEFTTKLKPGGLLISKYGLPQEERLSAENHLKYHVSNSSADIYTSNLKMHEGAYSFDIHFQDRVVKDITLNMGGKHNVENLVAAVGVGLFLNIDEDRIRKAVASYKGVKRRFEYIIKKSDLVYIDDYAHHPEELRALITGAKGLFSDKFCTVIFQPHLFSRTRDFAKEFSESLDLADKVILLPIYPARELPMPGVTSGMLKEGIDSNKISLVEKEEVSELINSVLKKHKTNLLITAGAGDIDKMVLPIKKQLERNHDPV